MESIKLIATYARVSTSNQENEGTIATQLSAIRDFAQKNNYIIVEEYRDDGWSGDTIIRPDLDRLRMDAKKKTWEAVLIYDPDRLARRYSYQELIMDELKEAGIEILFVTVPTPKDYQDKILHGVKGLFAEYERAKIAERFRMGKLRKLREGHLLVSTPLYGYSYIKNDPETKVHGHYEINEDEARVAKMIFEWIAGGYTIREVVRKLQELNIMPRKSKRGVWNTSTLITMLRNKTYIGEAHWGSSYAVIPEKPIKTDKYRKIRKSSRRIKPEEEWIASKIPVPVIIERDLFEKAQKQLTVNAALSTRNKKYQYLLSGKIHCSCGKTRSGAGPQRGKHLYYRCNDRIYSFPLKPTCREQAINAEIADNMVWSKIVKLMSSPELIQDQINRWTNSLQNKTKSFVGDAGIIEKEIVKLKTQEDRYNRAYGAGVFAIEQLKEYITPLKEKMTSLETQLAKIEQENNATSDAIFPSQTEILIFTKEAVKTLQNLNFETKRAIVTKVLDKVIGNQQKLEVYGYLPVPSSQIAYETIHRNSRPAERGEINHL